MIDRLGNEVEVGDYVAHATSTRRGGTLIIGTVTEISDKRTYRVSKDRQYLSDYDLHKSSWAGGMYTRELYPEDHVFLSGRLAADNDKIILKKHA